MEVKKTNNGIHVKNMDLGNDFSDVVVGVSGDLCIDQDGKIKVTTNSKLTFNVEILQINPKIFRKILTEIRDINPELYNKLRDMWLIDEI